MRALIVDDHPLIRHAIRDVVQQAFPSWTILDATTGEEALRLVREEPIELLVLDIGLPGESGLTVLKQIRRLRPETKCLMLSIHGEPQYVRLAMNLGAAGYLSKESAPEELSQAIKTVVKGERYVSKSLQEAMDRRPGASRRSANGGLLSARELEVLCLLAKGRTVSRAAKQLKLSVKTVSTYRLRLLDKLDLQTTADLIRYAVDHGLVR